MHWIYKSIFLVVTTTVIITTATAQIPVQPQIPVLDTVPLVESDTTPTAINPRLLHIFDAAVPHNYTITDIKVTGSNSFDPNLIISISGMAVGATVTIPGGDKFAQAIKNLWAQGLVSDVAIYITSLRDDNITVEIHITDRPAIASFKFKGINKAEQDELTTKLGWTKGKVNRVTPALIKNATDIIRNFYVDKGFRNVEIDVAKSNAPNATNAVDLVFQIDKNAKVRINEIYFAGNESVTDLKLQKQMKGTKERTRITLFPSINNNVFDSTKRNRITFSEYMGNYGFLYPSKTKEFLDPYARIKIFSSSKFDEKKYVQDKIGVLDYYNSLGFRDAVIVKDTVYSEDGGLDVAIKVNEGDKYYFGDITWKGNTKYSDSVLALILAIEKGDVYNSEILYQRLGVIPSMQGGNISNLYQDDGYLFFQITPVETSVYNDTIDFEIQVREGPQATIGKVVITGNDKTKEHVIRRELRTVPGQKFSRQKIVRTQRELAALGYFDPEKINFNFEPHLAEGTVDLSWGLVEKSSDQLELAAGFGGGIGLTGTLGVTFNNFSLSNLFKKQKGTFLPVGDGQKLSLRAQSNGRQFRSYNFSFTEPWLGGKKHNTFSVGYYDTKFANAFNPFTGRYDPRYADSSFIRTTGVSVSLGKQLKWPDDFFALIYQLNYQRYKLRNYNIFPGLRNGISNNISFKVTLARNSSGPNPIFPTQGSNFVLSAQLTPPYSWFRDHLDAVDKYKWVEFHKEKFKAEWYVPIGQPRGAEKNKQFILKAAAKFGFLGRYSKSAPMSPFERFQLGDAGLSNNFGLLGYDIIAHRGYPVYDNSNPKINPDLSQAREFFTIFNKYTLELRYPFSTSAASTIYGLVFFEAANGWFSFEDYNPFRLRRSVGVGMRFFLPMFGLLGFDYGIGLDRINGETGIKGAAKFTFMLGQEPE